MQRTQAKSQQPGEARGEGWAWGAFALLAAAAASIDQIAISAALLLGALAVLGVWLRRADPAARPAALGVLCLAAALASAVAWEATWRHHQRRALAEEVLPSLGPPDAAELSALAAGVDAWLDGRRAADLLPRSPRGVEPEDLAFALWRRSPLARPGALSALAVETVEGERSTFSFGLPLAEGTA